MKNQKFDVPITDPSQAVKINFKYPNGKNKQKEFLSMSSTVEVNNIKIKNG